MNFSRRAILMAAAITVVPLAPATVLAADHTIAGIVFQQDQYFRGVQIGMENAAKAASAELLSGNSDGKLEKETQLIDTYIARGVGAIVVAPLSGDGSMAAIKKARDAGIHVVTYGTRVNGDLSEASVPSSDSDLGSTTGKAAKEFLLPWLEAARSRLQRSLSSRNSPNKAMLGSTASSIRSRTKSRSSRSRTPGSPRRRSPSRATS